MFAIKLGFVLHLHLDKNQPFHVNSVNIPGFSDRSGSSTEIIWKYGKEDQINNLHFSFDNALGLNFDIIKCNNIAICKEHIAYRMIYEFYEYAYKGKPVPLEDVQQVATDTLKSLKRNVLENTKAFKERLNDLIVSASLEISEFLIKFEYKKIELEIEKHNKIKHERIQKYHETNRNNSSK